MLTSRTRPARSQRRPITLVKAAGDGAEFDINVVHTVDGASPADLFSWYEDRRERGIDRHDEVWDGVYVVAPLANIDHQRLQSRLLIIVESVLHNDGEVFAGANVSDRDIDWSKNFRGPDLVVVLNSNRQCVNKGAYFRGGPDLVVEIESLRDRSRLKFDFYASIGVREFLIVEHRIRNPLLYRREEGEFAPAGPDDAGWVASRVLPLAFRGRGKTLAVKTTRRPYKNWKITE